MANKKITNLTADATLADTDLMWKDTAASAASQKITGAEIKTSVWASPTLGGVLDGQGNDITAIGVLTLTEQAAAEADVAGRGQLWVKTATPNQLWFTDDAGTDVQLGVSSGAFTADVNTQITPSTAIVLDQATGNEVALDLSFTVNKLTSGNYTGIKAYATETSAPGTDDRLLDLGVGATNKLRVSDDGEFILSTSTTGRSVQFLGHYLSTRNTAGNVIYFGTTAAQVGIGAGLPLAWTAGNPLSAGDVLLYRDAANILAQRNAANAQEVRIYGDYATTTDYQRNSIKTSRTATTVPSAASFTLTGVIPAGALLIGVTSRVDTLCTTATGYTVGDGVDADLWGVAAAVAVGTATGSADFTAAGAAGFSATARDVVVTATGGNFDGTGVITVCAHYIITEAD